MTVGPHGFVAEAIVDAGASGEFGTDARRENGETGEAAGWQRDGFDLIFFEDVAVGGVHGVEERGGFDGDGGTNFTDFESSVDGGGAVALHGDRGNFLRLKSGVRVGERVAADGKIDEIVGAGVVGLRGARQRGLVIDDGDGGGGESAPVLSVTVPVMPPRVC